MHDLPWATWAIIITAVSNALAGIAGELPAGQSALYASAVIVLGAIGKALYKIGEGLAVSDSELDVWSEPITGEFARPDDAIPFEEATGQDFQ